MWNHILQYQNIQLQIRSELNRTWHKEPLLRPPGKWRVIEWRKLRCKSNRAKYNKKNKYMSCMWLWVTFMNTRLLGRFTAPIFNLYCEHFLFVYMVKQEQKKFADFSKLNEFLKFWWSINLSWGHVRSHAKFNPIGSAILTFIGYKQRNEHPDKQNIFIEEEEDLVFLT